MKKRLGVELSCAEIEAWLREEDTTKLELLWQSADLVRELVIGPEISLRGLVELSNYCVRKCAYCGINAFSKQVPGRFRMTENEILSCVDSIVKRNYGTVVLQAGEDYGLSAEMIADLVYKIKNRTKLVVALSLGERKPEELKLWREAGADRYFLRFETSDPNLYKLIHPSLDGQDEVVPRFKQLIYLRKLGYSIGSGNMVGIPGQSYHTLAHDIVCFRRLDLDMVGVGPYIPAPGTAMGDGELKLPDLGKDQVPNTAMMSCKVIALSRLLCPYANITSTTALATIDPHGRELGLMRGANVFMPNFSPNDNRKNYAIYPKKSARKDRLSDVHNNETIQKLLPGRTFGAGPGERKHLKRDGKCTELW